MPVQMDTATAVTEARTLAAPLTPHIQGVASSERRRTRRKPMGKQSPRGSDAMKTTTAAIDTRETRPRRTVCSMMG